MSRAKILQSLKYSMSIIYFSTFITFLFNKSRLCPLLIKFCLASQLCSDRFLKSKLIKVNLAEKNHRQLAGIKIIKRDRKVPLNCKMLYFSVCVISDPFSKDLYSYLLELISLSLLKDRLLENQWPDNDRAQK